MIIPEGQVRFRWFTSYWTYRNDMDTVGVRAGCTLFLFTDSDFTGDKVRIDGNGRRRAFLYTFLTLYYVAYPDNDRWVVLGDHASYRHMNEDVEAVKCHCDIQ